MTTESACPFAIEIPEVMTNLDHSIDETIAARLQTEEAFARYSGWEFNGIVWWDRTANLWKCEVWRYHVPRHVHEATSLRELHDDVCAQWGDD